jgi:hypothetical protein
MQWDAFICHASEDKEAFVSDLADALTARGLAVWYDKFALKVGDSLRRSIDRGLSQSRYGIVILSKNFFQKEWPQKELDALVSREVEHEKVILPVWHNVESADVEQFSRLLADRLALNSTDGIEAVADAIVDVIAPDDEHVHEETNHSQTGIYRSGATIVPSAQLPLRLFLHAETAIQENYNRQLHSTLRSSVSDFVEVQSEDMKRMSRAMVQLPRLPSDALEIISLDEYHIPEFASARVSQFPLRKYENEEPESAPSVFHFEERTKTEGGEYWAIPYYANIGLIAYRSDLITGQGVSSWYSLAELSTRWEAEQASDDGSVFFDFPQLRSEDYNCLFLEILLSIDPTPQCTALSDLFVTDQALEAAVIFNRLCRRAYLRRSVSKPSEVAQHIGADSEAVVWRHWYSTLSQMLSEIDPDARQQITTTAPPGRVSTVHEWYLAVTARSANSDLGLDIMKFIAHPTSAIERFHEGVGLPPEASFYEPGSLSTSGKVTRHSAFDSGLLYGAITTGLRPAALLGYSSFSDILANHLRRMLEVSQDGESRTRLRWLMASLQEALRHAEYRSNPRRAT